MNVFGVEHLDDAFWQKRRSVGPTARPGVSTGGRPSGGARRDGGTCPPARRSCTLTVPGVMASNDRTAPAVTAPQLQSRSQVKERDGGTVFLDMRAALSAMVRERNIVPHPKLYTTVESLHTMYKADYPDAPDPLLSEATLSMFRSALGRIFPPLRKCHGLVGLAGPGLASIDMTARRQEVRTRIGAERRAKVQATPAFAALREERGRLKARRDRLGVNPGKAPPAQASQSFRYIDEFLLMRSSSDMLLAGLFPNGKELAESMSAFTAVREFLLVRRDVASERVRRMCQDTGVLRVTDPSVTVVVVGDGVTPRTAGLFAFRTSWRCVSVDPALRTGKNRPWAGLERLDERPQRVQDVTVNIVGADRVVVIAWHAHVSNRDSLACLAFDGVRWDVTDQEQSRRLRKRVALVTCACCQWGPRQTTMPDGSPPDAEYEDAHVPGGMRTLRVWRFLE